MLSTLLRRGASGGISSPCKTRHRQTKHQATDWTVKHSSISNLTSTIILLYSSILLLYYCLLCVVGRRTHTEGVDGSIGQVHQAMDISLGQEVSETRWRGVLNFGRENTPRLQRSSVYTLSRDQGHDKSQVYNYAAQICAKPPA